MFIFSFPEFYIPRPFRRNLHLHHRNAHLILSSFILSHHPFRYRSTSWWFFMIYFILQSQQDFVGEIQVSFLLASRSVINSPYSFEVEFCISSFFSAIQSFPVCGRLSLYDFEMFSISPQQAYSFVVEYLNNSVLPFL